MGENQIQRNVGLLDVGAESSIKKVGETFASRALNGILDGVKNRYGETQVLLGSAFTRYLTNATQRYNQVRTLATGTTPRTLIGAGNIYVSIGVQHKKKKIDTTTIDSILQISNNILIMGTGGIGKSMMMRYFFLNTANHGEYIPVLLELRKISSQSIGHISILDLIYSCMNDFDIKLPREQFEYSLRLGKYVFLMDGFDEIKESQAAETAAAIQDFCAKYPKNPCIITSRPRRDTSPLETFTTLESLPLSKEQSVCLASKIWEADEKTTEFCQQLNNGLYEKHRDFAENPLLLSMMFLTFMRNNSIPNHLAEFYSKAYDALYSAHDSNDKGYYRREFRCKDLDETDFKLLLSHFCFQTYFKEDYEFSKKLILSYLQKSIQKLGLTNVNAADYLEDLRNVVCLIIEDGDIYRFSHRSFQTYFAACYTSNVLTDEQQKKLFASQLSGEEVFWEKEDYYELLSQIEPQRLAVNALEDELRAIQTMVDKTPDPNICFVKLQYNSVSLSRHKDGKDHIAFHIGTIDHDKHYFNIIGIFRRFFSDCDYGNKQEADELFIRKCIEKAATQEKNWKRNELSFEMIDSTDYFTVEDRSALYAAIARVNKVSIVRAAIETWLNELDSMRKKLTAANFIDDL